MKDAGGPTHQGALRGYEWSPMARTFVNTLQQQALSQLGIFDNRLSRIDDDVVLELAKARAENSGCSVDAAVAAIRGDATNDDLPTPFEVPSWYNMLLGYSDDIAAAAAEKGRPLAFRPMFATRASGQVNATTTLVPGTRDEFVIMFEAGLFGFLNLVSKLVASVLLTTVKLGNVIELDLDATWRVSREDVSRFFDVYGAYIVAGNPMYATRYFPSREVLPLHRTLLQGSELFVLGHELGHVIGGHFGELRHEAQVFPGVRAAQLPNEWQEELEADADGFELMLAVAARKHFTPELAYAGAEMFFIAIELLDYAFTAIEVGAEWPQKVREKSKLMQDALNQRPVAIDLGSHPPPAMRRDYIRQLARAALPAETARRAGLLGERVAEIMNRLWTETAPLFEDMHADGIRAAAIWREQPTA
jgi:hypothetical protein